MGRQNRSQGDAAGEAALGDEIAFSFGLVETRDLSDGLTEVGDEVGAVTALGIGHGWRSEGVVGVVDLPADTEGLDAGGGLAPDRTDLGRRGDGVQGRSAASGRSRSGAA